MSFIYGLSNELEKLAGEEGDAMYGHGEGEEKKKPSIARGAAIGAAVNYASGHGVAEGNRRAMLSRASKEEMKDAGRGLGEVGRAMGGSSGNNLRRAGIAYRKGLPAKMVHGNVARGAVPLLVAGGLLGAGATGIRRLVRGGEKKEAGVMGAARKVISKIPPKAAGGAALAVGGYAVGKHRGLKKGEGEAMQVGQQAYEAGARDVMSQLGIS